MGEETTDPGALLGPDDPTVLGGGETLLEGGRRPERITDRLRRAPAADGDAGADPRIGTVIDGRYKVLSRLGAGGMATVYKAWHLLLEKPVALKFIHAEASHDERFRQRFFREARVASELVHPNAVAMREFGETPEGLFYLVMDFRPGRSLGSRPARRRGSRPRCRARR